MNYNSVFTPGTINGMVRQNQETSAAVLFGTIDFALSDKASANIGLRYSNSSKDGTAVRPQPGPYLFATLVPLDPFLSNQMMVC